MNLKNWFITILIFVMLGFVGAMDYQDELVAQQHYTDMVCACHYPDYKELKPTCD